MKIDTNTTSKYVLVTGMESLFTVQTLLNKVNSGSQ